jgi:EAL domain-containing protein (putative c-di-GMP-specific phosphodiesterase class I)
LRDAGFGIARDDFGTGWSALDQLLWLPVDAVRLSPALTAALGTDVGNRFVRAVTELAHGLEQRVVIDDIQTHEQARMAEKLGCDRALGALWGAPQPAAAIDRHHGRSPARAKGA